MKILPKYTNLIIPVYLPIFLIILVLIFYCRPQILLSFRTHWLFLFPAVIVAFSPLGKIRLGDAKPISLLRWMTLVGLAGIGVIFLYYSWLFLVSKGLPVGANNSYQIAAISGIHLVIFWGFFPWILFLLIGIALAKTGFVDAKPGKFSFALQNLFRSNENDAISILSDFYARSASNFCLASSLAIVIITLTLFFTHALGFIPTFGLRYSTLIIVSIFMILPLNHRYWQKNLRRLLRKKVPYGLIMLIFISVMILLLVLAFIFSAFIGSNFPGWHQIRQTFPTIHWPQLWLIFTGLWWLSWIPLMSGLIAYLSRGFSIRKIIFGGAIVISVLQILMLLFTVDPTFESSLWFPNIFSIIGFLLISAFFFRQDYFIYEIRGTVPGTFTEKPRSLFIPVQRLLQNTILMVVFYFLTGIYLLTLFSAIIVIPIAILSLMVVWSSIFKS